MVEHFLGMEGAGSFGDCAVDGAVAGCGHRQQRTALVLSDFSRGGYPVDRWEAASVGGHIGLARYDPDCGTASGMDAYDLGGRVGDASFFGAADVFYGPTYLGGTAVFSGGPRGIRESFGAGSDVLVEIRVRSKKA